MKRTRGEQAFIEKLAREKKCAKNVKKILTLKFGKWLKQFFVVLFNKIFLRQIIERLQNKVENIKFDSQFKIPYIPQI